MRTRLLSTSALAAVFLVGALAVNAPRAIAQSTGGGVFTVTPNGITDPSGKPFVARGLDVDAKDAMQNLQGLQKTFPGLNMVRLVAVASAGDNAQTLQPIINAYTAKGIVVEVEDHSDSAGPSWYTDIYKANANNPYVWYETPNEPPANQTGQPQADIINALRAAGDKGPIGLQPVGGYDQSNVAGVLQSTGTNNVYVTPHIYDSSTNPGDAAGYVQSEAQQGHKAGVGVIVDEFGNAMDGFTMDPQGNATIQAVEDAVNNGTIQGGVAWAAGNGYHPDGADSACADPSCSSATSTGMGPMMQSWLNGSPPTPVASNGSGSGGGTTPQGSGSGSGTPTASNGSSSDPSGNPSGGTGTNPSTQTASSSNPSGQSSNGCSQPGATTTQADNTGQGSGGSPAPTDTSGSQTAQNNSGPMSFTPASQATPISFVPAPCTQVQDASLPSGGSSGGSPATNTPPPTQVASNPNGSNGGGSNGSPPSATTTDGGPTQVASNSNGSQNPLTVIQQNPQAWGQFTTVLETELYPLFQWFMGIMGGSGGAQPSQTSQQGQTQTVSAPSGG